jgi:hypothetical protein
MRTLLLATALLVAGNAFADGTFTGTARDPKTNAVLYIEHHAIANRGGPGEARVVTYTCPDGSPFARKRLDYDGARIAPSFRMEDARSGYLEGLTRKPGGLEVFTRDNATAKSRTAKVDGAGLIADAGFDEFVRARWADLERGVAAEAPFLVPSRLESMAFKVRKMGNAKIGEDAVSNIRLSLAGPLGWFVPDIDVSYRQRDQRLMSYRGTTNMRDANGKMIVAQIDFPAEAWREGAVDLDALGRVPLVSACRK